MVVAFIWIGSRGISAKAEPGRIETLVVALAERLSFPLLPALTKGTHIK